MNTIGTNNLLAEFEGKTIVGLKPMNNTDNNEVFSSELKYHESWDALMPVVEQINLLTEPSNEDVFMFNVTISANSCKICSTPDSKGGFLQIVNQVHGSTLIEIVYLAILQFIEWHNADEEALFLRLNEQHNKTNGK